MRPYWETNEGKFREVSREVYLLSLAAWIIIEIDIEQESREIDLDNRMYVEVQCFICMYIWWASKQIKNILTNFWVTWWATFIWLNLIFRNPKCSSVFGVWSRPPVWLQSRIEFKIWNINNCSIYGPRSWRL